MNNYLKFLQSLYEYPRKLQADFCRENARFVAEGASRGHISSLKNGVSHNIWMVTVSGVKFLTENHKEVFK